MEKQGRAHGCTGLSLIDLHINWDASDSPTTEIRLYTQVPRTAWGGGGPLARIYGPNGKDNTNAYNYVMGGTDKRVTGKRVEFAHPPNPLAKAIFELLRGMWTDTHIPKPLAVAQIVSLYKKGDALSTDNFRGLSMIETPAKLFLTLMGSRIRKALHDEDILSRSQAGFRPREECIAQGVTLREICLRRKLDGKKTYITTTPCPDGEHNSPRLNTRPAEHYG